MYTSFVTIHLQYFIMIFTLMSLTVSPFQEQVGFFFLYTHKSQDLFRNTHTHPHSFSARIGVCHILSTCVIAICKISNFKFTPYYLLGEQNCWMHHSVRMSAGNKSHSWGENNPPLCSSVMAVTHRVPFGANYIFFFFYNAMSPKESIIEQSLGIIYITVMNSSYNKCFMAPSAPYNVLWN